MPDKEGPMGWWSHPSDPPHLTLYREQSRFGQMEDKHPERFCSQPPKQANAAILARIHELQKADGLAEGSLDLRYIEKLAFGKTIPWSGQTIGSCVASGSMRAIVIRMLCEILLLGDPEDTLGGQWTGQNNIAPYAPYHYGWGRLHSGISGYSDGSMCSGQIECFMTNGWLPCNATGLKDIAGDEYPEPLRNTRLYKEWGAHKHIREFEPQSKVFDLVESERIQDTQRLWQVLDEFKPCMICSGWGFAKAGSHRDGFAIYSRRGSWAHNMSVTGKRIGSDGAEFVKIDNSWGESAHADGPYFYVTREEMDKWLRNAECRTIGNLQQRESQVSFW